MTNKEKVMIIDNEEIYKAYLNKKKHADSLGEAFLLDYEVFYAAWTHKARWHFRKPGWTGLVMTKIDHLLPYSNTNFMITTRYNSKARAKHLGMKKGDIHTSAAKEKMRKYKKTEEHRAKISATMMGRKRGQYKEKKNVSN